MNDNSSTPENRAGLFITFEGGDGVGKSTQIKRLAEILNAAGREVVVTREPGGSPEGEAIRSLLVKGKADRWSPMCEALLMFASRRDHLENTILPALKRDAVVLCDRFSDSSMAYQGYAGGLGPETVERLNQIVVGNDMPNITIILDAPSEEGLARAAPGSDETRFEEKGSAFQAKVREAYLKIAKSDPNRCVVVDARGAKEAVAERIMTTLSLRLPKVFSS